MDDGGEPGRPGVYIRGTGGILANSHSSRKGGGNVNTATEPHGTAKGGALTLNSVNPCASRVGWLSVANLTGDKRPRRRDVPLSGGSDCSAVWLTCPRRMKTPMW